MKFFLLRLTLAGLSLIPGSLGFSRGHATDDGAKGLFERVAAHPAFATTLYKDAALILEHREEFYAALAVVRSEQSALVCAYAAPFEASLGTEPGKYVLKPVYLCDSNLALKPYQGYFQIKYPECSGEICSNPAIGVGNLAIRPDQDFTRDNLPLLLPVRVNGDFDIIFDPNLPVAGLPFGRN